MEKRINLENLDKLIKSWSGDTEMLDIIFLQIGKFEEYYKAIYDMEMKIKVYSENWSAEEYRENFSELDNFRTVCHNGVISGVKILNNMAEKQGIGAIYDGVVSTEKPYRTILADAVFEFMNEIIKKRM